MVQYIPRIITTSTTREPMVHDNHWTWKINCTIHTHDDRLSNWQTKLARQRCAPMFLVTSVLGLFDWPTLTSILDLFDWFYTHIYSCWTCALLTEPAAHASPVVHVPRSLNPLHSLLYWICLLVKNILSSSYYIRFKNRLRRCILNNEPDKTRPHFHIFWQYYK